jgi:hypothetical protein
VVAVKDSVLNSMDVGKRESIRELISSGIQKRLVGQYGTSIPWVYVRFRGTSEA